MITFDGLIQLGFTPEIDFTLQNDGGDTFISFWNKDKTQPTEAEIEEADAIWQAEYDALAYSRAREIDFPTWQEQMDLQYWDQINGTTTWQDAIAKVKADNPKEAE